ncbi:MAG: dockerin type I repeat-containing protein, partial [Firmicutes bacterium]|nr:dockerin type I repeat-containing protein [Bacillota bacterium]
DTHFVYVNAVYKPGDVNTDGKTDEKDVKAVLRHPGNTEPIYGEPIKRANMNNDGKIDMLDVIEIIKLISQNNVI